MKWTLAALLAAASFGSQPRSADACGIKLVIKTSTPHKAIARSSNPSHLLLLGTPPHRLERELSAAGHDVEVEPDVNSAKRSSYAVVMTDQPQADTARAKFATATVIVASGDVSSDIASVETQVARHPLDVSSNAAVLARKETRVPVRTGGGVGNGPKVVVAAKDPNDKAPPEAPKPTITENPKPPPEAPKPPPEAPKPAITENPRPVVEAPQPKPPKEAPAPAFRADEVYFTLGSSSVSGKNGTLDRAAKALAGNGVNIVVEGYADPSGSHEANMALGQSRAEAVRDYLVTAGVDTGRIEVISYGDTHLKYGKADGRNRRVALQPKK